MEILKQKMDALKRALSTLERAVAKHEISKSYEEDRFEEYRDSLIQRFEYYTDLLWKVVKDYLEKIEGIRTTSPKPVFRECFAIGLITEKEAEDFLLMIDARNTTSHMYCEEFVDTLYKQIPHYYHPMQTITNKVGKKI